MTAGLVLPIAVLVGAILVTPLLDRRWGRDACWALAGLYVVAFVALLPAAAAVLRDETPTVAVPWVPAWGVQLALRADGLSILFAGIALLIGAVVFGYSTRYLGEGRQLSFSLVMAMFTTAMVTLVLADDLVLLFVAWELTSIASFLLIARSGHPGEAASMRTMLLTFIGGLALLAAVGAMAVRLGTTSLSAVLADPVWRDDPGFTAAMAVLVLIAGISKSAQFPFHVWLPDAMAAITPVSAYLHAAAVVKAGIFLLMRFTPAFSATPAWIYTLVTIGLITAVIGGWFALAQTDLKKLMAYSTVSQLGLIVAAVGVGTEAALAAAILHTLAHALFKSGLFMMVGVIDHATHTRDLRRLPPLARRMPAAFAVTVLGCASMAGIPPLLGFLSKEFLLAALRQAGGPAWFGPTAMLVAAGASVLTFAYCVKLVFGGFVDGRDDRPVHPPQARLTVAAALPIVLGLPLGLYAVPIESVIGAAVVAAHPVLDAEPHFTLWHGVTPELLAALTIYALGGIVIARRRTLWPRLERPSLPGDGAAVIGRAVNRLSRLGGLLVRPVAVDHPSRHLVPLVAAFVVILLGGLIVLGPAAFPAAPPGRTVPIDVVLLVLITAAVVLACRCDSRLGATVSISAVGILATVQILALGAPDVGLTQLLVESLTVIVVMLVLQKLPRTFSGRPRGRRKARMVLLAVGAGVSAGLGTAALNGTRDPSTVARYYQENATEVTGGANIVNVILVEFRALDTLGELAVLGMAGVVIVAVLSTVRHEQLDPPDAGPQPGPGLRPEGSTAHRAIMSAWPNVLPLQLMLRLVNPVLALISAVIFLRGHNAPGGGFIAALVGASIVGLLYLSTSKDRQIGPPRLPLPLIGGGVLIAVGTGLWGLVVEGSFLEPVRGDLGPLHLTSSMLFDLGVYAAVLGLVMVAFNLLGTSAASTDHPGGEDTRERADETVEGELTGPLDTVRGEPADAAQRPRVGVRTRAISSNRPPREVGR